MRVSDVPLPSQDTQFMVFLPTKLGSSGDAIDLHTPYPVSL